MHNTKRLTLALTALAILFLLAACGQADSAPAAGSPFTLEKDMGIHVDGKWYPIHEDAAPLLAALGDGYELFTAPSCVFVGEDKEFSYPHASVFTNPDGDRDIWYEILLLDDTLATARGIRVGDPLEDVIAAYGDNYYWEGDTVLTYSVSGVQGDIASPCILFTVEDNVVTQIVIYYPTNVT